MQRSSITMTSVTVLDCNIAANLESQQLKSNQKDIIAGCSSMLKICCHYIAAISILIGLIATIFLIATLITNATESTDLDKNGADTGNIN